MFVFVSLQCKKNPESYPGSASYPNGTQYSYNHNRNPGSSARDFLRSTTFKSLKIEIQYMPGFKPDDGAIDLFVNLLRERLNKPAGIFVEQKEINPTLLTIFTLNDISNIESRNRTVFTNGDQLGAYILITSGSYSNGNVLGLSYKNTSMCFFGEPLKYYSIGVEEDSRIKTMAMLFEHEFGHLLGLVDMGTLMQFDHMDAYNDNHCNNRACLMHHTYEPTTENFVKIIVDIPSFDANCIADLKANGGK